MIFSPVVLFVYNRPRHTREVIEALKKNELATESDLIIFSDAPKNIDDQKKVYEVRQYIKKISGFKKVTTIERERNFGLAESIIKGVTEVINKYGRVIVLEDDLVTSTYFLEYMNEALDLYHNENRVVSIHGYVYPVNKKLPETFFIKGADCWGWATWKRGWDIFEEDGRKLLNELKSRKKNYEFDFAGTYPYSEMLERQICGWNSSWAIRWYASAFLKDKLTLYPGRSLVKNIGMDESGTHSGKTNLFDVELSKTKISLEKQDIKENLQVRRYFSEYFSRLGYDTFYRKIKFLIKKVLVCKKR